MAVSQYLRPGGLLEAVRGYLTPDVLRGASSLTGESEAATGKAMSGVVPTLLSGVTNMASTESGASNVMGMIRDGGYTNALDNPSSFFGGGSTQKMMGVGQQLTRSIFGNRGASITDAVARSSGVKSSSAGSLMSLAAPLVMGVIGKQVATRGLNASGLMNMFSEQKGEISSALPTGLSQFFGAGPTEVPRPTEAPRPVSTEAYRTSSDTYREPAAEVRHDYAREPLRTEEPSRKWLYWVIPLALIALGFLLFRGRGTNVSNVATNATGALANITLPGGTNLSVPEGSINYKLAQFLGDPNAQVPHNFVFDHLNFQSASTQLTPESVGTVNNLASVLKAYPNAQVQLNGYTDNTGNPDTNQALSLQRANAIKDSLVSSGISADRISTAGHGQDNPVASNDTEAGKAQNRRIELVVTGK